MSNPEIGEPTESLERPSQFPPSREVMRRREALLYEMDLGNGRRRAREEGRAEGIRSAIRILCRAAAIEVGSDRVATLAEMTVAELEALLEVLVNTLNWPDDPDSG
ncbi:MAG: hypothetical protein JW751_27030 [Polyangiaceae bacterium]|nr:hypothetical protein [Polyangiaceae bacterium]